MNRDTSSLVQITRVYFFGVRRGLCPYNDSNDSSAVCGTEREILSYLSLGP
jgi:hypothetical protein